MNTLSGWVGCYTSRSGGEPDGGIGRLVLDGDGLRVTRAVGCPDPSYLALSPDGAYVYAVHELDEGRVSAYAVRPGPGGDALEQLGSQPTRGVHPCHVVVHPSGRFVLTANYTSGSVTVHPVGEDGRLGAATDHVQHRRGGFGEPEPGGRQDGPHAHMVAVDPAGAYLLVADLGLDEVITYQLSTDGRLRERSVLDLPPGTGPRQVAFHPSGHAAYVLGELDNTLTTFGYRDGVLTRASTTSTVRPGGTGKTLAAVVLARHDGKVVWVTNRGEDTVATFDVAGGGLLVRRTGSVPSGGDWPRDLTATADGGTLLVANERSGRVQVFTAPGAGHPEPGPAADYPGVTCVVLDR